MFRVHLLLSLCIILSETLSAQRRLTEATLHYTVESATADSSTQVLLQGVSYTCYIKGVNSRMELESVMGKESTLLLGKTGQVVILKEHGAQHYLTRLNSVQWQQLNQLYDDAQLKLLPDTLLISGYPCKKALFQFTNGTTREVWYTTQVIPNYREFQLFAKKIPGLLVQYEATFGKTPVLFKLKEVNYNPVQAALFDVPEKGFRILKWEQGENVNNN
ncbi:MAG: hypothetical protein FJY19_01600 [Bacteroidetes bacterium]|nr:hypothetical protein [Bacteroidota bacterium]